MEFKKINAPTLKELFIQQLITMILSGELKVGDKLPSERELCESMQVSRAVVNGGITELSRIGFLTIRPRIGAFVADYRTEGTIDTLNTIMNYNGGILRSEEIRSILELRFALDSLSAELCVSNDISSDDINTLKNLAAEIGKCDSADQAAICSFNFQHKLAVLSNNTLIPLIITSFKEPIMTLWKRYFTLYGIEPLYNNVYVLCQCIENKDLIGANNWLRSTIANTINGDTPIYF